jgi:hypothetical protein
MLFPSITCFRRQFLHKMWPIQWAFLIFIVCRMYRCSLTDCHTSSFLTDRSNWSSPAPHFVTFQVFLMHFPQCPVPAPHKAMLQM